MGVLVAAVGLASVGPLSAQTQAGDAGKWYIGADAGLSIMQNLGGLVGNGVALGGPNQSFFFIGGNGTQHPVPKNPQLEFDPGPRLDLSVGYHVLDNVAVEVEIGYTYYNITKLAGVSLSDEGASVDMWQVPVLVNGIYKYSFTDKWQCYGGLGIGGVASTLENHGFGVSDYQLAYQAMVGVKYLINDQWECDLGYKFLGTSAHDWDTGGSKFQTDPSYSHSILLSVGYKF